MAISPFQSYLQKYIPLASRPWLVAALRQDKLVCQAASELFTFNYLDAEHVPSDTLLVEDWSPAALALQSIAPSLSTKWLCLNPMPDLDKGIKQQAIQIANSTTLPTEEWSLDKAGWIALAIRSDYLAKGSWKPVLDTWLSDPEAQYGTVLACLYGMISDPQELFSSILERDLASQNIALVLHALLANPLPIDEHFKKILALTNSFVGNTSLPISARLVILHILQNQRPQLAYNVARHWLDTIEQQPTKVGWINQDPMTWFHDLEEELFQASAKQIIALEPSSVAIINEWKKLSFSPLPDQTGITHLSELVAKARSLQSEDLHQALHYGQKANQYLSDILNKIPNPLLADSRIVPLMQDMSDLFLALGRPQDSESLLNLACEMQPANPTLLIMNARSKQKSRKISEAVQVLATALMLVPSRLDIGTQLAEAVEAAGEWHTALSFRQVLLDEALANNQSEALNERHALAKCALKAEMPDQAFQVGQQLLQINPNDGMGYYYCGQAHVQMGKIDQANEYLVKATETSFNQPLPWLGLASLHQLNGDQEKALTTLQAATQAVPNSPEIHLRLGELYLRRNSYTQAQEALSVANSLAPTHPQAAYLYSQALKHLGHLEDARSILHQALPANPDDDQLAFNYAEILSLLGENEQALPYLKSILAHGPVYQANYYIGYAQVLLALVEKNPDIDYEPSKAVDALRKAIQIDPNNRHALALLAEALAATGDYPAALDQYQSLMDTPLMHESDWSSRLAIGMGRTALALGRPEVAMASLQDLIQNDPEFSLPYRLLAEAYLAAHLPENALRAAHSAISLRDEDSQTISWIVTFIKQIVEQNSVELSKPGNNILLNQVLEDSIRKITGIIQDKPEQICLAINLGELQVLNGDTRGSRQSLITISHSNYAKSTDLIKAADRLFALDDALAGIKSLIRAIEIETETHGSPSTDIIVKLARAHARVGNLHSAQETFDQAIQIEPSNILLYTAKSKLLLDSNQTEQALDCLLQASQNIPNGQDCSDFHYVYAYAHLIDGNLPAALDYAQQAFELLVRSKAFHIEDIDEELSLKIHPLEMVSLVAMLFRMLLQPGAARKYLEKGRIFLTNDIKDKREYIPYYCLSNELDLEFDGVASKDLEPPSKTDASLKNPCLLSLNARLAHRNGNPNQAYEAFNAVRELLDLSDEMKTSAIQRSNRLYNLFFDELSFVEAAIRLHEWDAAHALLQKAYQNTPWNPLVHLAKARFYIHRAEYQDLCAVCNVLRHSPGSEAVSENAALSMLTAFASIKELFDGWQDALMQTGLSSEIHLVERWQARADLVFEQQASLASAYGKLASFAQNYQEGSSPFTPDDTAAMVAASRRQNGQIDEKTNLSALFQMARKQAPHPALLLQIAISLSGHHPIEAMNASQLSIKHLSGDQNDLSALCHYYQAVLCYQQGMLSDAQEKLNIALGIWGDEPRWNALAAEILTNLGNVAGIIAHLEEAVKYEPKNIKHHLALGRAYLNGITADKSADIVIYQKRAIRNLERATRLAPEDTEAWLILAQAHYQISDMKQADECAERILAIDANHYGGLSLKAEIALRTNDPEKANDYAKRATLQQPDHPAAHIIHSRALRSLGRPEDALQALGKAIQNTPDALPLQLEHAGLVKQLYGMNKALEELQSIARLFPDDPEVLARLAQSYAECDEDDLAIESAQKSLSFDQEMLAEVRQAQMHHLLGRLLRKTGQLDQAIMHLHKAAQLVPDDVESYLELGIAHKERRDFQQALKLFQQATTIATQDPRPFYLAGLALKEGKDYRKSEVMLRKAANLAPQDVNIRRQLAAVVALNLVHNPTSVRANVE